MLFLIIRLTVACLYIGGPCFLCEEISNVKFEPCGHIVMCTECSNRTIKCPQCRVSD